MTTTILANAGVPMLAVQMPLLVMALPVVIAVEACLARRWLRVPWAAAWGWTAVANLVSTLVGFPIAPGIPHLPSSAARACRNIAIEAGDTVPSW